MPLFALGTLALYRGDFAGALAPLERGLDLCRTREIPLWAPDFTWALGAAYHGTGRNAEGIALMEDAARASAERHVKWAWWPGGVGALGAAYVLDGRLGEATRIGQDRLAAAQQAGERVVEGHLLKLLGDIAAHPARFEVDTAEAHYRQSQALAEALSLRPLLAHCHLGLGILSQRAGKQREARGDLETAETMFGEMDMRYWREQAKMAMAELA
jgi:tetratricopeptide (TPR) repeat protein